MNWHQIGPWLLVAAGVAGLAVWPVAIFGDRRRRRRAKAADAEATDFLTAVMPADGEDVPAITPPPGYVHPDVTGPQPVPVLERAGFVAGAGHWRERTATLVPSAGDVLPPDRKGRHRRLAGTPELAPTWPAPDPATRAALPPPDPEPFHIMCAADAIAWGEAQRAAMRAWAAQPVP